MRSAKYLPLFTIMAAVLLNSSTTGATDGEQPEDITLSSPVPGATTISKFGSRTHPITGKIDFHEGIDLAAPLGTPVLAAANGTVQRISDESAQITFVAVSHRGYIAFYLHLQDINVTVGQSIHKGQPIGTVGQFRSETPSIHFEIYKLVDPEIYISEW